MFAKVLDEFSGRSVQWTFGWTSIWIMGLFPRQVDLRLRMNLSEVGMYVGKVNSTPRSTGMYCVR